MCVAAPISWFNIRRCMYIVGGHNTHTHTHTRPTAGVCRILRHIQQDTQSCHAPAAKPARLRSTCGWSVEHICAPRMGVWCETYSNQSQSHITNTHPGPRVRTLRAETCDYIQRRSCRALPPPQHLEGTCFRLRHMSQRHMSYITARQECTDSHMAGWKTT